MAQHPQEDRVECNKSEEAVTPGPSVQSLIQDELADKYKLANVKEFTIQGNRNAMVVSSGEEIHPDPKENKFVIRIYDRERRDTDAKPRNYIQMSFDTMKDIREHEERIKIYLDSYPSREVHVFHDKNFSAAVVPSLHSGKKPMVRFTKRGSFLFMNKATFNDMMTVYGKALKGEHAEFLRRKEDHQRFLEEVSMVLAYEKNEGRISEFVRALPDWYKGGAITTLKKLLVQVRKSKEKSPKKIKNRLSNKTTP